MPPDFSLLTSSQAATLLGVHESSVKRWTNDGARAALAARERNDFGPLMELLLKLIDTRPPIYVVRSLRYLNVACGVPLARSFDLGICEALRRVGGQWADGLRTVAHELRFPRSSLKTPRGAP